MSLKIVIVEDEKPAAQKLARDLLDIDESIQILAIIHDVGNAIKWFNEHSGVDLVFMDIQLSDGLSFEILQSIKVTFPIIFTTAYDHYWQKALTNNGIDYLLKPIEKGKLKIALEKYKSLKKHFAVKIEEFLDSFGDKKPGKYKEKFLLRRGKELVLVPVSDIVLFKASEKLTLIYTKESKRLIVEDSLVKLSHVLDPQSFVRANRKFIINIAFIDKISMYSKGRIEVKMQFAYEESIIIPQDKAGHFKERIVGV